MLQGVKKGNLSFRVARLKKGNLLQYLKSAAWCKEIKPVTLALLHAEKKGIFYSILECWITERKPVIKVAG